MEIVEAGVGLTHPAVLIFKLDRRPYLLEISSFQNAVTLILPVQAVSGRWAGVGSPVSAHGSPLECLWAVQRTRTEGSSHYTLI